MTIIRPSSATVKSVLELAVENGRNRFAAETIAPVLNVENQSGQILYVDPNADLFAPGQIVRAPGADPETIRRNVGEKLSYTCEDRSLADAIPIEGMSADEFWVRRFNSLQASATDLVHMVRTGNEVRFRDSLTASMTAAGNVVDVAAGPGPFNDDSVNPIKVLNQYIEDVTYNRGIRPNALFLSDKTARAIQDNAIFRQYFFQAETGRQFAASGGVLTALAALLRLDLVHTVDVGLVAPQNLAADKVLAPIWGETALLYHRDETQVPHRTRGLARTLIWNPDDRDAVMELAGGADMMIDGYVVMIKAADEGNLTVRVNLHRWMADPTINPAAGLLITNTVEDDTDTG